MSAPIQLRKVISESTVDNIISQLVEVIISGELKPGDRLPTETALMEQLDVGRNSVREAIKVLVSYGVLEIRRADGTYVCSEFSPKMLNPLLYGILLESDAQNLNDLRLVLDDGIFHLAIKNATEEDVAALRSILNDMQEELHKPAPNAEAFLRLDTEFHQALSECTHNPLLEKINDVVSLLLTQSRFRNINTYMESEQGLQFLMDLHTRNFEIIKNRNPETIPHVIDGSLRPANEVLQGSAEYALFSDPGAPVSLRGSYAQTPDKELCSAE